MVGVPGKSKGCLTCRRRKIRCDLLHPDCRRCTQTGRTCEGYARYPTFLNRTLEGRQKRFGLEEAKPRTSGNIPSVSNISIEANTSSEGDTAPSAIISTLNAARFHLPRQANNVELQDDQIIANFWAKFVPLNVTAQDPSPAPWLQQILSSRSGGPAMQSSLKALAMTRLGWIHEDTALSARGHKQYGFALKHLQSALYDKNLMWKDDTLAAAYCLSIYELFEATDDNIKGWNSHVTGMGFLIQMRGPHHYRTPLARAILNAFSASSMIQGLQYRKKSFLGNEEWRTKPWQNTKKDIHDRLFEIGFEFGALLEEVDNSGLKEGKLDAPTCVSFPQRYAALDVRMDVWFQDLLAETPSPLFWLSSEADGQAPDSMRSTRINFISLRLAGIVLTYWGLKLVLSNVLAIICGALLFHHPALQSDAPETFAYPHGRQILLQFLDYHNKAYCLEIATKIMQSMPYVLDDNMGLLGAQHSLFPLRVALFVLRQHPGEKLRWCQAIYHKVEERKGMRYATELAKINGEHAKEKVMASAAFGDVHDPPCKTRSHSAVQEIKRESLYLPQEPAP